MLLVIIRLVVLWFIRFTCVLHFVYSFDLFGLWLVFWFVCLVGLLFISFVGLFWFDYFRLGCYSCCLIVSVWFSLVVGCCVLRFFVVYYLLRANMIDIGVVYFNMLVTFEYLADRWKFVLWFVYDLLDAGSVGSVEWRCCWYLGWVGLIVWWYFFWVVVDWLVVVSCLNNYDCLCMMDWCLVSLRLVAWYCVCCVGFVWFNV